MKEIKLNHYVDTVIYSIDMIIKNLKTELKHRIDKLNLGITGEQFVVLDTVSYYDNIYPQKLSEIMKAKDFSENIILSLGNDMPLRLTFELVTGDGRLEFLLAPRIEND